MIWRFRFSLSGYFSKIGLNLTEKTEQAIKGLLSAVAAVAAAVLLRAIMVPWLAEKEPYATFYPAIVLAALYGGWRGGLLGIALSSFASLYWLDDKPYPHIPIGNFRVSLLMFVAISLLIVWVAQRARRANMDVASALQQRRESEERIVGMLDSLSEAFVLLDANWNFLYVNRACEKLYGTNREQMLGNPLWNSFPHIMNTSVETTLRKAMADRAPVEFETFSTRLGKWTSAGAIPVAEGLAIYVQDIDDRKKAEQALRVSEEQYRQFVETAQEGVWMLDADDRTSYVNRAMADLLGYLPGELIGNDFTKYTSEQSAATMDALLDKRRRRLADRSDIELIKKDGQHVHARVSTNPIYSETGEFIGTLAMVSDISERLRADAERADLLKREQAARAEAETANRRKDQFLAVLSHELRTPLTPVLARLPLMRRDPSLSESMKAGLDMIRRNVELEARLIEDLLDITRLARGQMKLHLDPINTHDKIRGAIEIYQSEIALRKHQVIVELNATHYYVNADAIRLQQIFWNLVGNAVKYTPNSGTITVRSSNFSTDMGKEFIRLDFVDTGIGITPDLMQRLFDPFEQGEQTLSRRYGGLGLGLSISRSLAILHGGKVIATSAGKGMGSTFTVELPTIETPAGAIQDQQSPTISSPMISSPMVTSPNRFPETAALPTPDQSTTSDSTSADILNEVPQLFTHDVGPEKTPVELRSQSQLNTDTQPAAATEGIAAATVKGKSGLRILLVEDNEDTLAILARLLKITGHHVVTANCVANALAAAASGFDLLITDIGLPDGTGWDLMETLKKTSPVQAIALSGFSMDEDIKRSEELGFLEHLCKPVNPDDLEQAINRARVRMG